MRYFGDGVFLIIEIMKKKIAIVPGDGIGPEVMAEAVKVLDVICDKFGHEFEYVEALAGGAAIDDCGKALPEETIEVCEGADAILFGSAGGPKWDHLPAAERPEVGAVLGLRKHFGLFANLRPAIVYPALLGASSLKAERLEGGLDILIVRELSSGIYFGKKEEGEDEAHDDMAYRRGEIERIVRVGFEAAQKRGGRLCSVDKSNVLACSRLWRKVVEGVAREFEDVELSHLYVDNAAMQMATWPKQFDVIVTGNMFGDILSDLAGALTGSIGMLPSASLNESGFGMYEPSGGSAPDIAGQGIANPIAQILSGAMLIKYSFGMIEEADLIEKAVRSVLNKGTFTADIAGGGESVGTAGMGDAIIAEM